MMPEEVPFHRKVLCCAVGDALVYGKEEVAIVVRKILTLNHRREGVLELMHILDTWSGGARVCPLQN
jgi:hypothetical protein